MDLGLSDDPDESFRLFQGRIIEEYEKMVPEFGLTVIDATLPIEAQQAHMRQLVRAKLTKARKICGCAMRETYGELLPEMKLSDMVGKLIVIEGTDGAGRSTQINLLKQWLEATGPRRARYGHVALAVSRAKESGAPKKGTPWGALR